MTNTPQAITLFDLTHFVREQIEAMMIRTWVIGEISEVSYARSGHVYITLVEKSQIGDKLIAQLRCNMWANTARGVIPRFEAETGQRLTTGMKVMIFIGVTFSEVYGMSGTVFDINSSFTLGEVEQQRRQTLAQLAADGVMDMNKSLLLPTVFENIAVVSAPNAAGFGDFCNQLRNSAYGSGVKITLYKANMQGADAEAQIIAALERIAQSTTNYDAVAIMRGGGSRTDLACFDSYHLASNVAQFPLPILSGIGHERDTSVVDIVAHTRLKTPTAVAEFINAHNQEFFYQLDNDMSIICSYAKNALHAEHTMLERQLMVLHNIGANQIRQNVEVCDRYMSIIRTEGRHTIEKNKNRLVHDHERLHSAAQSTMAMHKTSLESLGRQLEAYDPCKVLQRGYTISYVNDVKLTSATDAHHGDRLTTVTANGKVISTID